MVNVEVAKYVTEVLNSGVRLTPYMRKLAKDLILQLIEEDIITDYIWLVTCISKKDDHHITMRLIVYDGDNVAECIATWGFVMEKFADPFLITGYQLFDKCRTRAFYHV